MALMEVVYKGLSDVRSMSKAELAGAGILMEGGLKWERKNRWKVYVQDPSDDLLQVFAEEGTFTVTEAEGDAKGRVVVKHDTAKADDTGSTVVDSTTGQVSTKK